MRTVIILLYATAMVNGGFYEDSKEILSSFKSVVDIPLSNDFAKAFGYVSFAQKFLKSTVPFGELLATALKVGIEEDKLEALLMLTNGINEKVKDIAKQQNNIASSVVYRDLLLDYRREVSRKVGSLLNQIALMSQMRLNVTQKVIDTFVESCLALDSPSTIASYMATMVLDCGEPKIELTHATQLFNLINSLNYYNYDLSMQDEKQFFERYSVAYFWITSHRKVFELAKFADDHDGIYMRNKNIMLDILLNDLEIRKDKVETMCLPKAAFVTHGFKRDSILRFNDMFMQHITSLEYITTFCANITYYNEPNNAAIYTRNVEKILQPVTEFVSQWMSDILNNTWPTMESLLIRNVMQDISKGQIFSDKNETYEKIVEVVHDKMQMVGHPSYRRQYVATKQFAITPLSENFVYNSRPNACTNSSIMGAHCISIRTKIDSNQVYEDLQNLIDYTNVSQPFFLKAMKAELSDYTFVERAIQILAEKYKLDFNQFTNHSTYIVLRKYEHPSGCFTAMATKSDEDLEENFLQKLHFHDDGGWFTDCEDWLVIFGF